MLHTFFAQKRFLYTRLFLLVHQGYKFRHDYQSRAGENVTPTGLSLGVFSWEIDPDLAVWDDKIGHIGVCDDPK